MTTSLSNVTARQPAFTQNTRSRPTPSKQIPSDSSQEQIQDSFIPTSAAEPEPVKQGLLRSLTREAAYWSRKVALGITSLPALLFGVGMGVSPAKLTGASKLHKLGIDGKGTRVAVLDMNFTKFGSGDEDVLGVYRVRDQSFHQGLEKSKSDIVEEHATKKKGYSFHGNAMACIITGESTGLTGVAPGAEVLGVSVVDEQKKLQPDLFIDGLQWVLDNRQEQKINAVSASVNYFRPTPEQRGRTGQLVDQLKEAGIPVFVAAGNSGPREDSILFPADVKNVVGVGAYTQGWSSSNYDDRLDRYSSRGGAEKQGPKLIAPGGDMFTKDNHGTIQMTKGTSNSAPMAAASYALLSQAYPDADYLQKMSALYSTAQPLTGDSKKEGHGAMRVYEAYQSLKAKS